MKLIIDIPEDIFNKALNGRYKCKECFDAITNGISLDKIRAEIEQNTDGNNHCDEYLDGYNNGMKDALEIIDKYTKGAEK